ncbi:hypothetical protein EYR41_008117 [Orbilia oligospora]|uniref:Uncharacterized protein n=1 Tax=Orbilia oligospora TaxID=2813651 RepID=A0A7C8PJJ7_ORBOL|nr:hypothetical protein TWF751_011405 [Orbilia oligospora]TGJ66490.1 hypothetical protein EYR41_008117 [Orbilia oligospora]
MVHIPPASFRPFLHETDVPCVCDYDYDGGDFATYPERRGFNKELLLLGNFTEHPEDETIAFLQSWLCFGLLSEVTKQTFGISDLTTTNADGQLIIESEKFPGIIETWVRSSSARHLDKYDAIFSEVTVIIEYFSPLLITWQTKYGANLETASDIIDAQVSILPPSIACSLALLAASIQTAYRHQHQEQPYVRFSRPASDAFGIPSLIFQRFITAGWCISDVARLSRTYSITTLYFASSFQRNLPSPDFHEHCDLFACSASQVDDTTYVTKHVDESCGCDHMESALDDVKKTLDNGGIPATIVKGDIASGGEKGWLEAVSFEDCKAVALSHVWSDGLGNVSANSIPECQVRRLKGLIDRLYEISPPKSSFSGFFKKKKNKDIGLWLDTLCIPLEKDYRKLAIKKMVDTYGKCDRVLMIDAELTQISMDQIPKRELLIRIAGSNWMRRMWTLQEAALNIEHLYVQFADGVLEYHDEAVTLTRAWERRKWAYEAIDTDAGVHNYEFAAMHGAYTKDNWRSAGQSAGLALSGFAGRNTTKPGDVYLCLGGMMDLDVMEIIKTPEDERTEKILTMMKYYPKSIIFSPGPKVDMPGYGWACQTFWKSKILSSAFSDAMNPAEMTEKGLRLEYQGYVINPVKLQEGYLIMNSKKQGLWIKVTYDPTDPAGISSRVARAEHDEETMDLGLIVPERDVARKGPGAGSPALLVSIYKRAGWKDSFKDSGNSTAIYTKALCTVLLTTATTSDIEAYTEAGYEVADGKKPNESANTNSVIYQGQIWFIA